MRKIKLFFACLLMAVLSIGQVLAVNRWTRVTTVAELTAGGTFILGHEATANSGTLIPLRNDGANATTSTNGYFYTGTTSGSSGNGTISMSTLTDANAAAYELKVTASSSVSGAINIQMADGKYFGNPNAKNTGKLYTTAGNNTAYTPAIIANDKCSLTCAAASSYPKLQYNTNSPRFANYNNTQQNGVFYKKNYKVTVTQPAQGSINQPSAASGSPTWSSNVLSYIKTGVVVTLSATPPTGYVFDSWTVTKTASPYTDVTSTVLDGDELTMPDYDVTVSVTWASSGSCSNEITVSKGTPEHGTFDLEGAGTVCIDGDLASATVSNIEPASGYRFKEITTTAGSISGMNITDIDANAEINVVFELIPTHKAYFYNGTTLLNAGGTDIQEGAAVSYSGTTPTSCETGTGASTTFAGWATATWEGKVAKNAIVPTFYESTLPVMGDEDVTYYAVFCKGGTPTLATSIAANDVIYLATAANGSGVTGYDGTKDATTSTTISEWMPFTVSTVTGGYNLTNGTNKVIAASSSFKVTTGTATTLTFEEQGSTGQYRMIFTSGTDKYALGINSTYKRFYKTSNSYTWFYVFKNSAGTNYMTTCCTELGSINGEITLTQTTAALEWADLDHVNSWAVQYKEHSAENWNDWNGAQTTADSKRSVTITSLSCGTAYDFKIAATAAAGYCDAEDVLEDQSTSKWNISYTLTNTVEKTAGPETGANACGEISATFSKNALYTFPDEITVTIGGDEATVDDDYLWDADEGTLYIDAAHVTGNVVVTIAGVAPANPVVTPNPTALSFTQVKKGADVPAAQDITLEGHNLTADLTVESSNTSLYVVSVKSGSLTPDGNKDASPVITVTPQAGITSTAGDKNATITISGGGLASNVVVNVTFNVQETYTVNWYVNGTKIDANSKTDVEGTAVTAPSDFSAFVDCVPDFHFIGWKESSAIDGGSSDTKPTLVTPITAIGTANVNYYAVFADGTPASTTKVFEESLSSGISTTGWTFNSKCYTLNSAVRMSTGSDPGTMTSPAISALDGDATLTFEVKAWSSTENGKVTLSASKGTLGTTNFTTSSSDDFEEVSSTLSGGDATTTITFTGTAGYRISIKNVKVTKTVAEDFSMYYTTCPHVSRVNLTAADVENGSISFAVGGSAVTSPSTADGDVEVDIVAAPETGYELTGISISALSGATYNSTTGKIELEEETEGDLTVTATFGLKDYTVTVNQTEGAGATLSGATNEANYGATINLSATNIPDNAQFVNWTSSDVTITNPTSATEASFTMPAKDVTVTANFNIVHNVAWAIANTPSSGTLAGVYVKGIVKANPNVETSFSNATYYICDLDANGEPANEFYVYRGRNVNNTDFTNVNQLTEGDEVIVYGTLKTYQGTKEFDQNNYIIANGRTAAAVSSVVVSGTADKTAYYLNESFEHAGLSARAIYNTGYQKDVTASAAWTNDLTGGKVTENTTVHVTATYSEIPSDPYDVVVTVTTKTLESIELSETALTGYKGIALPKPATVTAHFDDQGEASTSNVTALAVYDEDGDYDASLTTAQTIQVKYTFGLNTRTADYTVTLSSIANTIGTAYSVEKAQEIIEIDKADGNNLDLANADNKVYVIGRVKSVNALTGTYAGKYTIVLEDQTDNTKTIELYRNTLGTGITSVEVGDLVKAYGNLYWFVSGSKYEINEGGQVVWKQPKVDIQIANKTLEIGDVWTIDADIDPEEAPVTYSIKVGSDACITLDGDEITATAEGTATIIAHADDYEEYLGNEKEFIVTVKPAAVHTSVVILAEYDGRYYALNNAAGTTEVQMRGGKVVVADEATKNAIVWDRAEREGVAIFHNEAASKYLNGGTSTTLSVVASEGTYTSWTWVETATKAYYTSDPNALTVRTFLYQTGQGIKNYAASNIGNNSYAQPIMYTGEIVVGEITTLRDNLFDGKWGTYCPAQTVIVPEGASFYTLTYKEDQAGVPYKVFFDEIAEGASLEAGKPYLFIAEGETITGIKIGEPTTTVHPYNGFIGVLDNANTRLEVYAQDEADHRYYIIYGNEIRLCGAGWFNVPVERAYLDMSQMSATPVAPMPGRRRVALTNNAPQVETGIDAPNASETPVKVMIDGQLFILRGEKMYDAKGQLVK